MGSGRPRRWKLPFHHRSSSSTSPSPSPSPSSSPSSPAAAEEIPAEFLCPISKTLMADPVILPSGQTFERVCAELAAAASVSVSGDGDGDSPHQLLIPNSALKAAIHSWCRRSGHPLPSPPSPADAVAASVRRLPPNAADDLVGPTTPSPTPPPLAPAFSVRTRRPAAAASRLSSSTSSSSASASNSSSYHSSSEIQPEETLKVSESPNASSPSKKADALEEEILAKLMDSDEPDEHAAVMATLRQATRESAARRLALCTPRLLAALRPMLLSRHAAVQTAAAAAVVNLSLESTNKVPIVRAGAVPPLVEVLKGGALEAREHAAGAAFSLALEEDNRAAIGVLGAIAPLIQMFTRASNVTQRGRLDAGMALYHLSLAAANRSKITRASGAAKALLSVAADASEVAAIRRVAMMVVCNLAGCSEGRAALMDADAVATVTGLMASGAQNSELEEWCITAMYGMSKGSLRFRGLSRAAGAETALRRVAEERFGMRKEMARKTLRAMRADYDEDVSALMGGEFGDGDDDDGGSIVSEGLMSFRRRRREVGPGSCSNTTEF